MTGKNISSGSVNIRTGPGTTYATNGSVAQNASVSLTAYNQRWFVIAGGYVCADYFHITSGSQGTRTTANFSGSVNVRYEPNTNAGTTSIVYTLGVGLQVEELQYSSSTGWYQISCNKGTGWIAGAYLTSGSGSGGGTTYNYPVMVETERAGNGGTLSMRTSPSDSAAVVATIPAGTTIQASTTTGDWLPVQYNAVTGFVKAEFIFMSAKYAARPTTGEIPYTYQRNAAVQYAMNHALNYNSQYAVLPLNDCANFVSQCLYAGGMYMNADWSHPKTATGSGTQAWNGTVSMRDMLKSRKLGYKLYDKTQLLAGDLVFTYNSINDLPHVVMVSRDVTSNGNIYMCGHTANQRDVLRSSSLTSMYYHIEDTLHRRGTDWR